MALGPRNTVFHIQLEEVDRSLPIRKCDTSSAAEYRGHGRAELVYLGRAGVVRSLSHGGGIEQDDHV
ncbi:hypothetical protein M404DRAFT_1007238 [Pisolithus tinctorius Marx 270]|uniref:Uncharacterized protein n=1 Tax=Pisolithus tinctorius Marx 270 TaxID=870435 RepID=A0A0C3N3V8_PISTI|nr:hypothetical protein M404DRAFT_1007238 [Pisolithus tinctorius Marx 270]